MKLVLCTAATLITTFSWAGRYEAGLTTGLTATVPHGGGTVTSGNGSISASANFGGNGSVSISGTPTTVFSWKRDVLPDDNTDPSDDIPDPFDNPPEQAIVVENCSVVSNATANNGSSCNTSSNNGLGTSTVNMSGPTYVPIPSPPYYIQIGTYSNSNCSGSRAKVVSGGQSLTVNGGSVSGSASSGNAGFYTNASYSASVHPVILTIAGTVRDGQASFGEIGGRNFGIVSSSAPGISLTNYQWSVDGSIFKSYVRGSVGFIEYVSNTDLASSSPYWSWRQIDTDTKNVDVTADVVFNSSVVGSVSLNKSVTVEVPISYMTVQTSALSQIVNYGLNSAGNPSVDVDGTPVGIRFQYKVQTNPHFSSGTTHCAQLISADWHYIVNFFTTGSRTTDGRYDLDNSYPYNLQSVTVSPANFASTNPLLLSTDSDSPEYSVNLPASVAVATSFDLNLMYVPDSPNAQPVPLRNVMWNWTGDNSSSAPLTPTLASGISSTSLHPVWDAIFSNSP